MGEWCFRCKFLNKPLCDERCNEWPPNYQDKEPEQKEWCWNCKYFDEAKWDVHAHSHAGHYCHRYPPQPYWEKQDNVIWQCYGINVKTRPTNWCGEYVRSDKENT